MNTDERLIERCIALEELIIAIKPFYHKSSTTDNQKAFLETVIGAGLWYFPHNKTHWNKKISRKAIQLVKQNSNSKLTRDHIYPRKLSGRRLLSEDLGLTGEGITLFELYQNELATFAVVTPEENRKLIEVQQDCKYGNWLEAYSKAQIELIDFDNLIHTEEIQFISLLKRKV